MFSASGKTGLDWGRAGWSLYGAPWLQPVAIGRKRDGLESRGNKRKQLP
jgi:hypothetical protein